MIKSRASFADGEFRMFHNRCRVPIKISEIVRTDCGRKFSGASDQIDPAPQEDIDHLRVGIALFPGDLIENK